MIYNHMYYGGSPSEPYYVRPVVIPLWTKW